MSDGKVGVDVEDERPRHHSNSSDDVSSEGKRDLHYRVTLTQRINSWFT